MLSQCDGHHVHPDGEGLRLSRRRARLVLAARAVVAGVHHDGGLASASRRCEEALARHGKPEIFNTDQGSQFTGADFTGVLIKNEIAISMDGKGAWRDNVFVERLWRSGEVRGGLSARLRQRAGRTRLDRTVSRSLQSPPPALEP